MGNIEFFDSPYSRYITYTHAKIKINHKQRGNEMNQFESLIHLVSSLSTVQAICLIVLGFMVIIWKMLNIIKTTTSKSGDKE